MKKMPVTTLKEPNIFSDVTCNIERERSQKSWFQISHNSPQKFEAYYPQNTLLDQNQSDLTGLESVQISSHPGAVMTVGFDSVENLQRFVDDKYPPGTGAWKRIAHLLREAQGDTYIKGSPNAINFLQMIVSIADLATGDHTPDQILKPVFMQFKSSAAKKIRKIRTDKGSAKVKEKALSLYAEKNWVSVEAAARGIFDAVYAYGQTLENRQVMSRTQFPKTLRGWLKEQEK